jgi:EAL domain-containing protein (putative c-di-GMP-specific phosphodiesterase class I)
MEWLRTNGCDVAQGYRIAKPMAAGELAGWVAEFGRQLVG